MSLSHLSEAKAGSDAFMALADLDQAAMDALPEAVYVCAGDGRVVRFNQKAVELWGRAPKPGDPKERFCGSFRLFRSDGEFLPHDECPMAVALQTGRSFHSEEVVVEQPCGRRLTVLVNIAPIKDKEGRVTGAVNCFQDITGRKQAADRQRQLIEELNHRIRNMLATVHSVAANTARNATSIDEFASRLDGRLFALSQAHMLLSDSQSNGVRLRDLLAQQFEHSGAGQNSRVRFEGPEVELLPRFALDLSMMAHELTTNAAKYGSLSVAGGQIMIEWDLPPACDGCRELTLKWTEADGPPVKAPQRTGFGMRLIKTIADGLDGRADLRFEPSGLQLTLSIPLPN